MTNKVLKQKGRNNKYPDEIWTWRLGEIVPEWLSDIAKVSYLEGQDGNIQLEIVSSSTGGYELKESSGLIVLVKARGREDFICMGTDKRSIFSLSPLKLKLLYNDN